MHARMQAHTEQCMVLRKQTAHRPCCSLCATPGTGEAPTRGRASRAVRAAGQGPLPAQQQGPGESDIQLLVASAWPACAHVHVAAADWTPQHFAERLVGTRLHAAPWPVTPELRSPSCAEAGVLPVLALLLAPQGPEKEARLAALVGRISEICGKRGVMIKPFFDDAATDDHSGNRSLFWTRVVWAPCKRAGAGSICWACNKLLNLQPLWQSGPHSVPSQLPPVCCPVLHSCAVRARDPRAVQAVPQRQGEAPGCCAQHSAGEQLLLVPTR